MLKIYNQKNTFSLEQSLTSAHSGKSLLELCEMLGNSFCSQFQRDFKNISRVIVFAGQGFNGALALAVSRILYAQGVPVFEVIVLNATGLLSDECAINLQQLRNTGVRLREVSKSFNPPRIEPSDVVIDGICGIELSVPFEGDLATVSRYINSKAKTILSIDIPSGLMAEDNSHNNLGNVIKATHTYTFHGPKLSFLLKENADYVGQWKVIDIGIDQKTNREIKHYLFTASDLDGKIRPRSRHTNKYDYGKVALIAGSRGMMGAALLSGKSCLRSGVGHLTVHVPKGYENLIHSYIPEALVSIDKSESCFTMFSGVSQYDAIGIGPGLGCNFDSAAALEGLLKHADKPMVIDADAINLIASNPSLLSMIPENSILTPHPGEFDRLVPGATSDYDRLIKASQLAVKHKLIIVLKGAYSATCLSSGDVIFNASGNAGMATAGSGDVLMGCILALLGKGMKPHVAAVLGVYINGYAGDLYAQDYSQESLIASDIINYIARVFKIYRP